MLLAYIDEIGETGAFKSHDHAKYNTSAAFGYAGFIISEQNARRFGAIFSEEKAQLFSNEIAGAEHPGRWERKGAEIFTSYAPTGHPGQLRVFDHLVKTVGAFGGKLFYYADEKPLGTPKETNLDRTRREREVMEETLNRIARHAQHEDENVMVLIDQITEKTRAERLPNMYGHILGRASGHPEMRRIIEPPTHVDSQLSSNIQFADWVAACVGRAIDYQLINLSRFAWISDPKALKQIRGSFTYESKLHLHERSVDDFNHSAVFNRHRVLHPRPAGQLLGSAIDPTRAEKMRAIAGKGSQRPTR